MARNNSSVSGVGEGFDLRRRNNRFIGFEAPYSGWAKRVDV